MDQLNQRATSDVPALSVVVACVERAGSLSRCLDSLLASCANLDVEIIVALAGHLIDRTALTSAYPGVEVICLPDDALVPRLWSEGIAASHGAAVALTLCQCTASREWGTSLLAAMAGGAAAAGGPITLPTSASIVDSAVFFLRYSAFMSDKSSESARTVEIAGDNSVYSRHALDHGGWTRESGFWEVDVNEVLRERGDVIAWVPSAAMEFANAGSLSDISHRRFEHGKLFGQSRTSLRGESPFRIALAAPAVPFVLMTRAARRAWPRKEYRAALVRSVPAFAWLSACWAFGEAFGAIEAAFADRH